MMLLAPWFALALVAADAPVPAPIPAPGPAAPAAEAWHLTLAESIRIGLANSEVIRCLPAGVAAIPASGAVPDPMAPGADVPPVAVGPTRVDVAIARVDPAMSPWQFREAVMAHVRSIEQQYRALGAAQVNLWARETAVRLAEEVRRREQAELEVSRKTSPDLREVEEQLTTFRLNLVAATSDVATVERQLRNLLGLPAADNRRIVPDTAPVAAWAAPDWDASVRQMLACQPAIAGRREALAAVSLQVALGAGTADEQARARAQHEREQAQLRQVVHEGSHNLARFFLEVDANSKQAEVAGRLVEAAQKRLESQRGFYEEGRLTIDRLLDAISQYANAIGQQAQYQAAYGTSLAAFEEARGTLLAAEGIVVSPRPAPPRADASDPPADAEPKPLAPTAATYKVRATVAGFRLLDVEVQVSPPAPAPR